MQVFLKIYLPVYLLIYLAVAFILPSFRTWKQTGINPVTFGKEDTAHNYIGFIMKLLIALLFFMTLVYSLCHRLYNYLLPVWYLENQFVIIAGLAIIHVALIWIMIAQFQMSNSWRIGIDEKNKTQLVTKRNFQYQSQSYFFRDDNYSIWFLFNPSQCPEFLFSTDQLFYYSNSNTT